jgi:hypothetical protein
MFAWGAADAVVGAVAASRRDDVASRAAGHAMLAIGKRRDLEASSAG